MAPFDHAYDGVQMKIRIATSAFVRLTLVLGCAGFLQNANATVKHSAPHHSAPAKKPAPTNKKSVSRVDRTQQTQTRICGSEPWATQIQNGDGSVTVIVCAGSGGSYGGGGGTYYPPATNRRLPPADRGPIYGGQPSGPNYPPGTATNERIPAY